MTIFQLYATFTTKMVVVGNDKHEQQTITSCKCCILYSNTYPSTICVRTLVFCNYIMTTYVINLMANHVLPHGNTFVILPTNDHVHKKMPCASTIIVQLGFHILPLIQLFLQLWNSYSCI
jgi:hypothetical protein